MTPTQAHVYRALLRVYETTGRATVRSVMRAAGFTSPTSARQQLLALREQGRVEWTDERQSTLRPVIRPVVNVPLLRTEAR